MWQPRTTESPPESPTDFPALIFKLLHARGFRSREAMFEWLNPSLKGLRDPLLLKDMNLALPRLTRALVGQESVCLYGDYDLDGTSALALLKKGLELLGFQKLKLYQPSRLQEGYGLHVNRIEKLAVEGVQLIVTVDLGITAIEPAARARELGMDLIVTDHHLPGSVLPSAVAVINPNRSDCESGLGHLCGTGVAFYLVLALKRHLQSQGLLQNDFDPKLLLDCFAIGTLTDMVPLIAENRVLVKHGLLTLQNTERPGLRALLQHLNLDGQALTAADVAIKFAPKLNALSRMDMGLQPLDLYLVESAEKAGELVEQVMSNNKVRQKKQRQAEQEAQRMLEDSPPENSICLWSPLFHQGIVGLVATRMVREWGLPAFVGSLREDGSIVGSARLPDGSGLSLLDAFASAEGLLVRGGGHAMAAGFELSVENAPAFALAMQDFFAQSGPVQDSTVWTYDVEARLEELNASFMRWYEHLSPFGQSFNTPLFYVREAEVLQAKELSGGHMRLILGEGKDTTRTAIWFSPNSEFVQKHIRVGERVQALVEPQWNVFKGQKTLQLLIQDLKPL